VYIKQVFFDTQHEIPKVLEFVEFGIAENEEVFCTAMAITAIRCWAKVDALAHSCRVPVPG
jgi:hypothetical protein